MGTIVLTVAQKFMFVLFCYATGVLVLFLFMSSAAVLLISLLRCIKHTVASNTRDISGLFVNQSDCCTRCCYLSICTWLVQYSAVVWNYMRGAVPFI